MPVTFVNMRDKMFVSNFLLKTIKGKNNNPVSISNSPYTHHVLIIMIKCDY